MLPIEHFTTCYSRIILNYTIMKSIYFVATVFRYVVSADTEPRTILSTAGESLDFVTDFTRPEQWKRRTYDEYNPYTAQVCN